MSGKGRGSGSTWSGGRGNGTASTKTGDAAGRGGRGGTQSSYQRQQSKGKRSYQQGSQSARLQGTGRKESLLKAQRREEGDALDKQFGYERYDEGPARVGWMFNMLPTSLPDADGREKSGLDMYFLEEDGGKFKATVLYEPYFYVAVSDVRYVQEAATTLRRRYDEHGMTVTAADKEDLDMPNHLSGKLRRYLRLSFTSVASLQEIKQELLPIIKANQERTGTDTADNNATNLSAIDETTATAAGNGSSSKSKSSSSENILEFLVDIREHDVPYYIRCSIDLELRVGAWYSVEPETGVVNVTQLKDKVVKTEPKVLAYDIECTKAPLKFPTVEMDQVFMISYMCDGRGYLIISREVVGEDIADFEYTPKPQFPGPFTIFNEANEEALLRRFFQHVRELQPHIFVTYNGDYFDWPFVDARAVKYGMSMEKEIGIYCDEQNGEYRGRCSVHLDAIYWVKRDSYLPQGSQGLKAVTRAKLGYDPVEVDPEDMVLLAHEKPTEMASYSVSDAVATYYLYEVYVHLFIFSLCTVIPMGPEDVLRKGSGTLCEALLMVEAYRGNIVCPNKHTDPLTSFYGAHLLESETYIGGHVECLETGVFRSDLPQKFRLTPSALQGLMDNVDRDLAFALEVEHGIDRDAVISSNYDSIRQDLITSLEMLRDTPAREEEPVIYHLDVAAMYPNIILSNRLQPAAIVDQATCAACDFNTAESNCKRPLKWAWRGDMTPASRSDYEGVKMQMSYETVDGKPFGQLSAFDQATLVRARLKDYARKVYRKTKVTVEEERVNTVCMRENDFYVSTVRAFRDRRYDYKILTKKWKKEKDKSIDDAVAHKLAGDKEQVYDSLQLAHKCILNSFYGYVMRKGARWRSIEMAGIVTYTGAALITQARELVEQVGRPLELDTDGIWCILPKSFPSDFTFKLKEGGNISISYPCVMLNADVHERYTNHQYQELVDPMTRRYTTKSECSIFFEVDGPYRCMVLPSSTEEGKLLKKRYAVFNTDGSLAELKGFELKRRGELEIVKIFQSQVFERFLHGTDIKQCYAAVADVANHWLDVLDSRGEDLADDELLELISENKVISRELEDYGTQKGTSLTTARRLADFLGSEMVKDRGLNCRLIISNKPHGAPVTDRAIPTAIFSAEPAVMKHFLRKWLKDPALENFDIRSILDWEYYRERLGKTIQKIITIPAAMQDVDNPVPRIQHPDWLQRLVRDRGGRYKQRNIKDMFSNMFSNASAPPPVAPLTIGTTSSSQKHAANTTIDIEDATGSSSTTAKGGRAVVHRRTAPVTASTNGTTNDENSMDVVTTNTNDNGADAIDEDSSAAQVVTCPSRSEDFAGWLAFQTNKWRTHRSRQKTGRVMINSSNKGTNGISNGSSSLVRSSKGSHTSNDTAAIQRSVALGSGGLQGYLRNAQEALYTTTWQVIEIRQSDSIPGIFTLWAMTGQSDLRKIQLRVNRSFYVNARPDVDVTTTGDTTSSSKSHAMISKSGVRVTRQLPHGRPAHHLIQVTMAEDKYQRNAKEVSGFLRDPHVEGVYELGTPPLFRAIMAIGCLTRVSHKAGSTANSSDGGNTFALQDMELVSSNAHPYLQPSVANFKIAYLFQSRLGKRGVVGIFFTQQSSTTSSELTDTSNNNDDDNSEIEEQPIHARASIWFVNPFKGGDKISMSRIFDRVHSIEGSTCSFKTSYVDTIEAAWSAANTTLLAYGQQRNGPTCIVTQTAVPPLSLRSSLSALNDFPVIPMPSNGDDSRYPALGWLSYAGQRMIQRYLLVKPWLLDRLDSARYSHIPVANLGADARCTMADVTYGRLLQHNRHVLWASEATHPDIGGSENEDNDIWSQELHSTSVCNPGAYRNLCVELDIYGLGVNSVLASGELEALEGSLGIGGGGAAKTSANNIDANDPFSASQRNDIAINSTTVSSSGGDDAAVANAFKILKAIVSGWLSDLSNTGSPHADALLVNFYRWVCARESLLQDPALHRLVHRLMHKVFSRFVSELRRLGATIVFANFHRVIIATSKTDVASAKEYVQFVVDTVVSRRLFACLQIEPKTYWEQLLFMDEENFGGIQMNDTVDNDDINDTDGIDIDTNDEQGDVNDNNQQEQQRTTSANGDTGILNGTSKQHDDFAEESSDSDDDNDDIQQEQARRRTKRQQQKRLKAASNRYDIDDSDDNDDKDENEVQQHEVHTVEDGDDKVQYDELGGEQTHSDSRTNHIVSHWNIGEHLQPAARQWFLVLVGEFMYRPRERALDIRQRHADLVASLSNNNVSNTSATDDVMQSTQATPHKQIVIPITPGTAVAAQLQAVTDEEHEGMLVFMQDLVARHIAGRVLRALPDIALSATAAEMQANEDGADNTNNTQQQQIGISRKLGPPGLEFIKSLCHVLALDTTVAQEVENLRKQALAAVGVRQFSDEGAYYDDMASTRLILPDVICSHCQLCADIDLCRDPGLTAEDINDRWRCRRCGCCHETIAIEARLVEIIQRQATAYQLADARCASCKSIATHALATACPCGGKLELRQGETRESHIKKLRLLQSVAQHHEFVWTYEVVTEMLALDGQ